MNWRTCVNLVSALQLLAGFGRAGEIPDASAVASLIGQQVEFQDEVKAVSYSRSTRGYYLSFGAAYPNQALSVWTDSHTYEQLPMAFKLVGRTARVRGLLESSESGPLLKIASVDQFQVVEVDEAVLSQLMLDGRTDRHRFSSAVLQLLSRDDFRTLETLADELRRSRETARDGRLLLDTYFGALHVAPNAPDEDFAFVQAKLDAWPTARPASLVVPLLQAQLHRDLAWHAVKTGSERSTTSEHRRVYRSEMATAREILEQHSSGKLVPEYYDLMQSVATCQRWPKPAFFALFDEATRTHSDYYGYYLNAAEYLLPYWRGKPGEWEAFAEQQRQRFGPGAAGDALYARICWSMLHRYKNLFRETAASWEETASGFEFLIRQHPESAYLKNVYANMAWKAGDRVRLRRLLPSVADRPDMDVWVNLQNVGLAEKFAKSSF